MSRAGALLTLALPTLAISGSLAACSPGDRLGLDRSERASDRDPGYAARDAEVLETGRDGRPRYRLRASLIEQDPDSLEVRLENPVMRFETAGETDWQVSAEKGWLPAGAQRVRLNGKVTLEGGTEPSTPPITLRTDQLDYDLLTERAVARGAVQMEVQGHVLEARGLEADLRNQRARLLSEIHGNFTP